MNHLSAMLVKTFGVVVFGLCVMGHAMAGPTPGRLYRLQILDSQLGSPYGQVRDAMLSALAGYGYRLGDNLELTALTMGNDVSRGADLLRQRAAEKPDVVYVGGTAATLAARQVLFGSRQPVVFAAVTDPVGIGVIDGFDRPPKANFTGICYPVPVSARLRFIRHLLPQARRLGLIYADMPQSRSYNAWIRRLIEEDPAFGDIEILSRPVSLIRGEQGDKRMAAEALSLLQELEPQVDAFISPNDQLGAREAFVRLFQEHSNKPLIGLVKSDVMSGWGAMASVFSLHDNIGQLAAEMIRDLFEGKPMNEIAPRWPSRFGYAVDLAKANALGISVPVGILQLAGENIVH